ncbi:WD40-repeat-containing domain protein [Pisolithus microcarpus]|nr:WD40-repeat-containing domain protein [Pisolithus microcarpus]
MESTYVVHKTLLNEHTDSVNALSFSPCGRYLASGSSDRQINALLWHSIEKDTLICGCEDSAVFYLSDFSPDTPVFCLDLEPNMRLLAIGVGNKVHITKDGCLPSYTATTKLPHPQYKPQIEGRDCRIRPRSIHFYERGKRLIVSYLNHSVIAWDIDSMTALWHIRSRDTPKQIASSAVYLDLNAIVINTLQDGVYLFKLGSTKPVRKWVYDCEAEARYPLLVSFLHDRKAIISGSPTGSVCIWQTGSDDLYQVLPHSGDIIQAVSAAQRGAWSYVATASSGKGADTYIKIWRAKYCAPCGQIASFLDRIMIFHFSLDWSDYGRMSWTIMYSVVCAAVACGLVRLAWYNIPWTWIATFLTYSIGKVIILLWQTAQFSYECLHSLLLIMWGSLVDVWVAGVSYTRSALRTFIGLPPVGGFPHPPYPQVPPQYDPPVPILN